ncbi:MAG: SDR family oxidoreductase [Treponema sp.]|jgi:NAD(P)-dependent dehydrogenase (short-subunit alcohol dehydrogenase family)|nr:SDR family oxidoreductase [Treponema sp.]
MKRLQNKVIVVSGGTKGIGEGISRVCAACGAFVVLSGRDAACGESVAADIRFKGGEAVFIKADITKTEDCFALIAKTVSLGGRIDGLVNNAAVFPQVPLLETTEDLYDSTMASNIKGPFFTTQRALDQMIKQGSGSIVNIGSTHWRVGPKDMPVYSISKGALKTLTENVALYYIGNGVRCNWVTVGWVVTPGEIDKFKKMGKDPSTINEIAVKSIPSGKVQTPEDIAWACVYFLSDESAQVTGADITVTGGFHSP